MLAVITPFSIMTFFILVAIVIFIVVPKIKNSKKIDKLTDDMVSSGLDKKTTSSIIDSISDGMDNLSKKSKDVAKTIKDATAESKVIDKVLKKDK